jgi:CDP-paratose 2-epimerase
MPDDERPILITGGAGFIGVNLAHRLLLDGRKVLLFDNLSRAGVRRNLEWLSQSHPAGLQVRIGDVRDAGALVQAVKKSSAVFHFAAQVAVTSSLTAPMNDFEINLRGTLKLLEALRAVDAPPPLVFTSTNKVYGALENIPLVEKASRYVPADPIRRRGIDEQQPLDFRSAYGCSKGAADQYVIDYARSFGLRTIVFRMSCIYGPHQYGTEDQGWVAHVISNFLNRKPITIYGNGKQVRDLLFVEDLIDAFIRAMANADRLSGNIFNIGGGSLNTVSLLELVEMAADLCGWAPEVRYADWRLGDQRYYVTNTAKFSAATEWRACTPVPTGIERLYLWLKHSRFTVTVQSVDGPAVVHQHAQ